MAEPLYAFIRSTAQRLKRTAAKTIGGATGGKVKHLRKGSSGSSRKFFKLIEDASGEYGPALAQVTNRTGEEDGDIFELYWWDGLLSGARAGYKSTFQPVGGEAVFEPGRCLTYCYSDGFIDVGTPPEGYVGNAFTHNVGLVDIDSNSVSATGLPDGLSLDSSGVISGIPTESGSFYVVISGTSDKTGPGSVGGQEKCTITKAMKVNIGSENS